ncbi:putative fatty acyl-CoA reductase CG8306 [Planococcus citri]|uniref:putative fatty acyl-CoA reductase CG8306 n=1 Tax=Planococcus citri TaxID=170843 RepID=UPI0031F784B5
MPDQITGFYNKKENKAFITGATGFVGLALIEKLLRCFPSMTLYLLIRSKYKKDASARWEDLKRHAVFTKLKEERDEHLFDNVVVVAGDVGEENLGLSEGDKANVIENVNMVYHCAATLDFDTDLPTNVNINLLGTKRILELCGQLKNCKGFLHVSSAYVNSDKKEVDEVLYEPPEDTEKVLDLVKSLDMAALDVITKKIIKSHPNSYTFTKSLAEHEVDKANVAFPTAIIRPSMILGSWKEPVPGWTASKNGPQGFLMGAAKGVIRRLPINVDLIYDYIPVDIVVNFMIVSLWSASINWAKGSKTPVHHVTSGTYKPFRWNMVNDKVHFYLHQYPLKSAVWYPNLKFLPSLQRYRISAWIFHMLPAFILDFVTKIFGGKPILVRLHTKVNRSLDQLEPFIFNEWKFHNPKALQLQSSMSEEDKKLFYLDMSPLNWEQYFHSLALGVRLYLNNEKITTLGSAKIKDNLFFVLNIFIQLFALGLLYGLISLSGIPYAPVVIVPLIALFIHVYL